MSFGGLVFDEWMMSVVLFIVGKDVLVCEVGVVIDNDRVD